MKDYLNQLDTSQREAVLYDDGPSLVVAGAGSGKTRVLTYKIVHLLQNGYQPHSILALTFTNKAAREMKSRIAAAINEYSTRYLWMGTFHAIFSRILRREAHNTGYPDNFTIYDQEDSRNLIKTIIKEMNLDEKMYRPNMVQSRISKAKNALITCNAYSGDKHLMEYDRRNRLPLIIEIYQRYQSRCLQAGAMDFDDLLLQTNILFRDHPETLAKYQNQFCYVLVDEYQDVNFAQHLIISRLCEQHQHVFVVGDDAQSIYSFRGANIENMLRFKEHYPGCKIFKLEQNYRSTQNIVDAANSLIAKNNEQIRKTVYSLNEKGSKLIVMEAYSDYEESYLVSGKIGEMMQEKKYKFADFAVLYRTNAQSRLFEEAFRKRMIRYKIYGSQSFYQRKEIKDTLAYMRLVINPKDEEALKRVINFPMRGIGNTTLNKLQQAALASRQSLWDVLGAPAAYQVDISKGTANKLEQFRALIEDMQRLNKELNAAEIGEIVVKMSGIHDYYISDKSFESINRLENVNELIHAMKEFVELRIEENSDTLSLSDFLMEASLLTDQDNDKDEFADKVTLMTVHAAKGLEFKNVFVVGMEEELFPASQSMFDPKGIEEERRLFYVAITRAKENCIITYAENRYRNGERHETIPSCFLDDIDRKYLLYLETIELPNNRWEAYTPPFEEKAPVIIMPSPTTMLKPFVEEKKLAKTVKSLAGFTVGDKVLHERFGEGIVLSLEGMDSDAKATVEFTNVGTKNLLLKYAKLVVCK